MKNLNAKTQRRKDTRFSIIKSLRLCVFALIFSTALCAEDEEVNFDFENCPTSQTWAVSCDFLRWIPCSDDLTYASKRLSPQSYKIQEVSPEGENGFRLGLRFEKLLPDRDFLLSWTHLKADTTARHDSNAAFNPIDIFPSDILYNNVKAHWSLRYDEWKALLGYDLLYNEYYYVKNFFGIAGINLQEQLKTHFSGGSPSFSTKWEQHTSGIGATINLIAAYRLSENFDTLISCSGSLLAARGKTNNETDIEIQAKTRHRIASGYEIGAFLRYDTSLFNKDTLLHAGYQFLQWSNLKSHKTIGFHGFIVGLDLSL